MFLSVHGRIAGDVHGEGCLSHGRTRSENDKVRRLEAGKEGIECGKARGNTAELRAAGRVEFFGNSNGVDRVAFHKDFHDGAENLTMLVGVEALRLYVCRDIMNRLRRQQNSTQKRALCIEVAR